MTTKELYIKHKSGEVSNQKFLYEVRRDARLPWITNMTSYEDAVKILKNKGIINEADEKKYGDVEVISKTIDMVNPYEYSKGMNYELDMAMNPVRQDLDEEEVLAAQKIVLKNITKDSNYYTKLYAGLKPTADVEGYREIEIAGKNLDKNLKKEMEGRKADGYIKKELKKDAKANVKDNLGDSEKAPKKPKGVSEFKDKGVTGSVKVVKEGIEAILREKLAKKKVEEAASVSQSKKEKARAALTIHLRSAKEEGDKDAEKEVLDARDKIMKASSLKDIVNILDDYGYSSSEIKDILGNVKDEAKVYEHHNDPNFPVVKGLYDLLDAIVADWGKEDLYNDVEDVIAAYIEPDATTMSKEAIKKIKDVLENYDVLEDYAELVNNIAIKEPGMGFRPGVNLGSSFDKFKSSLKEKLKANIKKEALVVPKATPVDQIKKYQAQGVDVKLDVK
jgi:hypothetical protein